MNESTRPRRNDGFMNVLSGLGAPGLDRTMNTVPANGFHPNWLLRRSVYHYAELYMTNGIAQKIIDRPADDAFQAGPPRGGGGGRQSRLVHDARVAKRP